MTTRLAIAGVLAAALTAAATLGVSADAIDPQEDLEKIHGFFKEKFPSLPWEEFANGSLCAGSVLARQLGINRRVPAV